MSPSTQENRAEALWPRLLILLQALAARALQPGNVKAAVERSGRSPGRSPRPHARNGWADHSCYRRGFSKKKRLRNRHRLTVRPDRAWMTLTLRSKHVEPNVSAQPLRRTKSVYREDEPTLYAQSDDNRSFEKEMHHGTRCNCHV
jgi:hypothetical protein